MQMKLFVLGMLALATAGCIDSGTTVPSPDVKNATEGASSKPKSPDIDGLKLGIEGACKIVVTLTNASKIYAAYNKEALGAATVGSVVVEFCKLFTGATKIQSFQNGQAVSFELPDGQKVEGIYVGKSIGKQLATE